jgi:hypothetical protein
VDRDGKALTEADRGKGGMWADLMFRPVDPQHEGSLAADDGQSEVLVQRRRVRCSPIGYIMQEWDYSITKLCHFMYIQQEVTIYISVHLC